MLHMQHVHGYTQTTWHMQNLTVPMQECVWLVPVAGAAGRRGESQVDPFII